MYVSSLGHVHLVNKKLHEGPGLAVQMGTCSNLSGAELIKKVCVNDEQYLKVGSSAYVGPSLQSDFYTANDRVAKPAPIETLSRTRKPAYHQRLIRPIHKLYHMYQIDEFEPSMIMAIDGFNDIVREETLKNLGKQWT